MTDLERARESRRKWYKNNSTKAKAKVRERQKDLALWLKNYKSSGLSCRECGESHPATLDFHHRDASQKVSSIRTMITNGYSRERVLAEIEKCDVLCSNCHRKIHWGRGLMA